MTLALFAGLLAACFGLPVLWKEHRMEFWGWLALYAGQRLGLLVRREEERRRTAFARAWWDRPIAKVRMR